MVPIKVSANRYATGLTAARQINEYLRRFYFNFNTNLRSLPTWQHWRSAESYSFTTNDLNDLKALLNPIVIFFLQVDHYLQEHFTLPFMAHAQRAQTQAVRITCAGISLTISKDMKQYLRHVSYKWELIWRDPIIDLPASGSDSTLPLISVYIVS